MSIKQLVTHINALVKADPSLAAIIPGLVFYGVPKDLPAIYIDGVNIDTNNRTTISFNLCYVTTDMSVVQFDKALSILTAVQQSPAIVASRLIARPEPASKVNGWIIPCVFYASRLPQP